MLSTILDSYNAKDQDRIILGIAVPTGLLIVLGISTFGKRATQLVPLTPFYTQEFPKFVKTLVDVNTVLTTVFGGLGMLERMGVFGLVAFILAFVGGILLLTSPLLAVFLIGLAGTIEEVIESSRW